MPGWPDGPVHRNNPHCRWPGPGKGHENMFCPRFSLIRPALIEELGILPISWKHFVNIPGFHLRGLVTILYVSSMYNCLHNVRQKGFSLLVSKRWCGTFVSLLTSSTSWTRGSGVFTCVLVKLSGADCTTSIIRLIHGRGPSFAKEAS